MWEKLICIMDWILSHRKEILFAASMLVLLALIECVYLKDIPYRDVAHRYIPMAEAFAAGDFQFAFHPRIPPLQPLCGGIVAKCSGVDAYLGLKIASAIWHLAGGVLIWLLFRTVYPDDRRTALFGTLLYGFFPYMFHMAYSGMRESAKCTVLILLALALVRCLRTPSRWRDYLLLGIAAGLGGLIRAEMSAVGMFCIFCAAVFESVSGGPPRRSAFATVVALCPLMANALVNYRFFGHAMPDSHFAWLFVKHLGRAAVPGDALAAAAGIAVLLPAAAYAAARLFRRIPVGYFWGGALFVTAAMTVFTALTGADRGIPGTLGGFFLAVISGMYYFVVPVGLVHVGRQIYLRKFTSAEHAILLVAAANFLLSVLQAQIFSRILTISSRYLFPATPLFFGFFLLGWEDIYRWLQRFLPKWCTAVILALSIAGLCAMYISHLPQPLYREHHASSHVEDTAAIREICRLMRQDQGRAIPRRNAVSPWVYRRRSSPNILFRAHPRISVATYFLGWTLVESPAEADYIVSKKLPRGIDPRNAHLLGRVGRRKLLLNVWRIDR